MSANEYAPKATAAHLGMKSMSANKFPNKEGSITGDDLQSAYRFLDVWSISGKLSQAVYSRKDAEAWAVENGAIDFNYYQFGPQQQTEFLTAIIPEPKKTPDSKQKYTVYVGIAGTGFVKMRVPGSNQPLTMLQMEDVFADANPDNIPLANQKGNVAAGFWGQLSKVDLKSKQTMLERVHAYLLAAKEKYGEENVRVVITGHSLGAAVAPLLAWALHDPSILPAGSMKKKQVAALQKNPHTIDAVVTFADPPSMSKEAGVNYPLHAQTLAAWHLLDPIKLAQNIPGRQHCHQNVEMGKEGATYRYGVVNCGLKPNILDNVSVKDALFYPHGLVKLFEASPGLRAIAKFDHKAAEKWKQGDQHAISSYNQLDAELVGALRAGIKLLETKGTITAEEVKKIIKEHARYDVDLEQVKELMADPPQEAKKKSVTPTEPPLAKGPPNAPSIMSLPQSVDNLLPKIAGGMNVPDAPCAVDAQVWLPSPFNNLCKEGVKQGFIRN